MIKPEERFVRIETVANATMSDDLHNIRLSVSLSSNVGIGGPASTPDDESATLGIKAWEYIGGCELTGMELAISLEGVDALITLLQQVVAANRYQRANAPLEGAANA
jgi:hypothetical protein